MCKKKLICVVPICLRIVYKVKRVKFLVKLEVLWEKNIEKEKEIDKNGQGKNIVYLYKLYVNCTLCKLIYSVFRVWITIIFCYYAVAVD